MWLRLLKSLHQQWDESARLVKGKTWRDVRCRRGIDLNGCRYFFESRHALAQLKLRHLFFFALMYALTHNLCLFLAPWLVTKWNVVNLMRRLGSWQTSSKCAGKRIVLPYELMLRSFAKLQYCEKWTSRKEIEVNNGAESEQIGVVVVGRNLQISLLGRWVQPRNM